MNKHIANNKPVQLLKAALLLGVLTLYVSPVVLAQADDRFTELTEAYADALVNIPEGDALEQRLEDLLELAQQFRRDNQSPESIYLEARLTAGYATTQSVLRMPGLARKAKNEMELALETDPDLLDGAVTAYLGYLYMAVPGWPLSFGSEKKGTQLLEEAMSLGESDLGVNYFYAYKYLPTESWTDMLEQLEKARSLADENTNMPRLKALLLREIESTHKTATRRLAEESE